MPNSMNADHGSGQSKVTALLPESKRKHLLRYWTEYLASPGEASQEILQLQADLAAGMLLPPDSALHPSTAVAVAAGLLQYHRPLAEGLSEAYNALTKLHSGKDIRQPLDGYVVSALEELSFRLSTIARHLREESKRD